MVEFFGSIDKDRDGNVTSEMPAWFFDVQTSDIEESIARKKRQIDRGEVPPEHKFNAMEEIKSLKQKLDQIRASKPKLGRAKDKFANAYHDLKNKIADSMPTRLEDRRGYVDPRDELDRWKKHHVKVDPEIANACGVKCVKGKVSGDGANKMYRMIGRVLGENTNVERIRKEGRTESQRTMEDLTRLALQSFQKGA